MTPEEISELLAHNIPDDVTADAMAEVREIVNDAALSVAMMLPLSRERSLFVTHIQQAQMWAICCLALHGGPEPRERDEDCDCP